MPAIGTPLLGGLGACPQNTLKIKVHFLQFDAIKAWNLEETTLKPFALRHMTKSDSSLGLGLDKAAK